jgi:hypothetical protein
MIEKNVLFFYDVQGFERDKENIETMFPVFKDRDGLKINAKFTSSLIEFKNSLLYYQLVFIDYGGAGYGSVEAFNDFFHNLVEDNPNKTFCWLLTMGRGWYGNEELFSEYPNVKTLDNGELFDGLSPMIKEFA